jgi:hypothetical protein
MERQKVDEVRVTEAVRRAKKKIKDLGKTDPARAEELEATEEAVEQEVQETNRQIGDPDSKRSVIPSEPC